MISPAGETNGWTAGDGTVFVRMVSVAAIAAAANSAESHGEFCPRVPYAFRASTSYHRGLERGMT